MTSQGVLQITVYFVVLLALTKPLGSYMARVYEGERTFLHPVLRPLERFIYALGGVKEGSEQRWTQYAASLLAFSAVCFVFTYADPALSGTSAAESCGIRSEAGYAGPVLQHRRQLHDEHKLAILWRRDDPELFRPDGCLDRPEFRFGCGRNVRRDSSDQGICPAAAEHHRQLLGRSCERNSLHPVAARIDRRSFALLTGCGSELQRLYDCNHA